MLLRLFRPRNILLVLLALLAFEGWRAYTTYDAVTQGREKLTTAAERVRDRNVDLTPAESAAAATSFEQAQSHFAHADDVLRSDPLVALARRLPRVGDQVQAVTSLVSIGRRASDIGIDGVTVFETARAAGARGEIGPDLLPLIASVQPELDRINAGLDDIDHERARIGDARLLPPLADAVGTVDRDLATVHESIDRLIELQLLAPQLLGYDTPRTYLVLTQDNTEITGAGGLVTVYGLLTLNSGRIESLTFSNTATPRPGTRFVEPPAPLRRYLLHGESWNLATSGWSPDFPTAARAAQSFLSAREPGRAVDGVIAMNFYALESLLESLGPLPLPSGVALTAANATETILAQTHSPEALAGNKFAFVEDTGRVLLDSLFGSGATRLVSALDRLSREKQVMVYLNDPVTQASVTRLGLDGGVASMPGDYLMLADASVLSTKLNLIVETSIDLRLSIGADGTVHHHVTVNYRNPLPAWASERDPYFVSQVMLGGVYGGYVRLLVPKDATLNNVAVDGSGGGLEDTGIEAGRGWYGAFLPLLAGQARSLTFDYTTPSVTRLESGELEYVLTLQKQSGTRGHPVSIAIELPAGAHLTGVTLDGRAQTKTSQQLTTDLSRDRELRLRYVLP